MNCFKTEIDKTVLDIRSLREDGDLCFALLTDTHLSDEGEQTIENISAVDCEIGFDCIVHLGNLLNANNPEKISRRLLREDIENYRGAVASKKLFVSQGDQDGWRDERFIGQLVKGIMTDSAWSEDTEYLNDYENISRPEGKPYYYVDFPESNIRLVVLCSYHYQYDKNVEFYQRYVGIDAIQVKWFLNEALAGCEDKTVLIFSHRIPQSRFECGNDPFIYKGNSTEPILAIIQQAKKRGVNIACWFAGAYGIDSEIELGGFNYAVINSQLSKGRELGTVEQDCWDAVLIKEKEHKIYLFRFGAGEDRIISY